MKPAKQDKESAPVPVVDIDSLAGRIGALNGVSVEREDMVAYVEAFT